MAELESKALETDVSTSAATRKNGTIDETPSQQLALELMETVKEAEPDMEGVTMTTTNTTAEEVNNEDTAIKKSSNASKEEQSISDKPIDSSKKEESPQDADKKPYKREQTSYSKGKISKFDKMWKDNIKSEMTSQPESSDPVEIRKQVEFYFSDSNLLTDKFLFEKVEGHKNVPIPLSLIHAFKRMRHFQPYSAIVDAMKESAILDLVDDESVKRKIPLPVHTKGKNRYELQKIYEDKAMARSVYLKGFGKEGPTTQFDIEAFFTPYGPVNSVRLRRTQQKLFKGSVFVEFDSEETAKAFLQLDPKPKWKGEDLLIKSKKQYCDEKIDDINAGNIEPNTSHTESHQRVDNGDDDRDWRDRRADDQKKGFRDNRHDKGNKHGSRGGRGGHRGKGRGGREQHHWNRHEVPGVKTTEDSTEIGEPSTASPRPENDTANVRHESNGDEVKHDATVYTEGKNSKKRAREEGESTEVEPGAKKVDTKDES